MSSQPIVDATRSESHSGNKLGCVLYDLLSIALILCLGIVAYSNSMVGVFLLDDHIHIVDNPLIRSLSPLGKFVSPGGLRQLTMFSFALNYQFGGLDTFGYHLANLGVHLTAAVALFGLLRMTFVSQPYQFHLPVSGRTLATTVVCLWVVHPVNSQAVNYIIQRSELLFTLALFLFLLLCSVSAKARLQWPWLAAAWFVYCLGFGCKELMVTALPIGLLYDRAFLSPSWIAIWRARKWFYMACLAPLAIGLVVIGPTILGSKAAVGLQLASVTPIEYLRSQPGVILHYLRLCVIPWPLIFDHGWPVERSAWLIAVTTITFSSLLALNVWLWFRWPRFAFWFLSLAIVLAPTSSIVPLQDLCVEHRMYAPSAFALVILASAVFVCGRYLFHDHPKGVSLTVCALVTIALAMTTYTRNSDYHSPIRMWTDVIQKTSTGSIRSRLLGRAYSNLGEAYGNANEWDRSIEMLEKALQFQQFPTQVHANLARAYIAKRQPDAAVEHYQKAIELSPESARIRQLAGLVESMRGQFASAEDHFRKAHELDPSDTTILVNLGVCLVNRGRLPEAEEWLRKAITADRMFAEARQRLVELLLRKGRNEVALEEAHEYQQLFNEDPIANLQLGQTLVANQRIDDAISHLKLAAESSHPPPDSHLILGNAYRSLGRHEDAQRAFADELKHNPNNADAMNRLAESVADKNPQLSIRYFERVTQLAPNYWQARFNLAILHLKIGQTNQAVEEVDKVLQVKPDFQPALDLRARIANAQTDPASK